MRALGAANESLYACPDNDPLFQRSSLSKTLSDENGLYSPPYGHEASAMSLGARLTELRLQKKQSLQDVASAVGASKVHIWELEKGRADNPSMALVTRLADHFGLSVASLVGEDPGDSRVDPTLGRMFRQAKNLEPNDLALLDDMMQSLLKRRGKSQ